MKFGARSRIKGVGADYWKLLSKAQCLYDIQIRKLFEKDMNIAVSCAKMFVGRNWFEIGTRRQSAISDMAFNLGCRGLYKFINLRSALRSDPPNYNKAILEMKNSRWCRQVGNRCGRDVSCMR